MKTFLAPIMVLWVLVAMLFAAAPTDRLVDACWRVTAQTDVTLAAPYDTLITTSDSAIVATKVYTQGTECVLSKSTLTGAGTGSIAIQVYIICYNKSNTLLGTVAIDTITTAGLEYIRIPDGLYPADHYSIIFKTISGHSSSAVITHNLTLWFRQTVIRPN